MKEPQEKEDDFTVLPTVGEETEEMLKNAGHTTFEDIVSLEPIRLQHKFEDIVLSNATQIINGALEQLNLTCTECGEDVFTPTWTEVIEETKENSDVKCNNCTCDYVIEELTSEQTEESESESEVVAEV